jgi:catalase-peroxidase
MSSYQKIYRGVVYEPVPSAESVSEAYQNQTIWPRTSSIGVALVAVLGVIGCLWSAGAVPASLRSMSLYSPTYYNHMQPLEVGLQLPGYPPASVQYEYDKLVREINWKKVERDVEDLLTDSQEWWPADYGNYGGLFIRLSWHNCGSYRTSDGRGGCDGGAQRYVRGR